ncbi:MAG TPA: hypothetical protein VLZ05_06155 [Mycobacterium sp.]|jgi:hypothetical protein|nr:hypothetical protein [Mycobacterium sp.]HUH68488.1 hypothetical protein [Mycobacterium sp.]
MTLTIHPIAGRDPYAATRLNKNLNKGAWSIRATDGPTKQKSSPTPRPPPS